MEYIQSNVLEIQKRISESAERGGRSASDITLLGVTKTVDIERIRTLLDCGIKNLGENRVQELIPKFKGVQSKVDWHFIGNLQTNKVKHIIDKVTLIHSVDSEKLAVEIDKRAERLGKAIDVLIEINISNEHTKHGIPPQKSLELARFISEKQNICLKGLMTVAPHVENPNDNRIYFRKMREIFVDITEKINNNIDMKILSMGMTNDYEVAIEEGSNIVRIGTGIFGNRTVYR